MQSITERRPAFALRPPSNSSRFRGRLLSAVSRSFERILSFDQLNLLYTEIQEGDVDQSFIDRTIRVLNLNYAVSDNDLAKIPSSGSLIVVSNHPFGAAEGVVLTSLLGRIRSDVRVLANSLLCRIPELNEVLIPLNPFGTRHSIESNATGLRSALRWLKRGGVLVVFPAGEVAHFDLHRRSVIEPDWLATLGGLVRLSRSPVLPVFFEGANGAMFQLAGLVHPMLRTAMLPHQLLNKRNKKIEVRVGNIVSAENSVRLCRENGDDDVTRHLRARTFLLAHRCQSHSEPVVLPHFAKDVCSDRERIRRDVAELDESQMLACLGSYRAFIARAEQIPNVLNEIGRLREITFRTAGEGTGKDHDLDEFDPYYRHLFVWSDKDREVVGAYRLGATDEIISEKGIDGLYTSEFFDYDKRFFESLGPAMELGRSFVRLEYQKSYQPLLLLWRAIGKVVASQQDCGALFGAVSISSSYADVSRLMIRDYLRKNEFESDLATAVKTRPMYNIERLEESISKTARDALPSAGDLQELSDLVNDVEDKPVGVPVLLRQYLKLGGKIAAFCVDPHFNNSLDGLIVVDLKRERSAFLQRFVGVREDPCGRAPTVA